MARAPGRAASTAVLTFGLFPTGDIDTTVDAACLEACATAALAVHFANIGVMAVLHISEADLARDIHAVLDRVQSGAEVIVERDAQPIAILRAPEPRRRKLSEISAALAEKSAAEGRGSIGNEQDEYSRIREGIVASGLPMLSDDEVRAEIRDRRGERGNTEP